MRDRKRMIEGYVTIKEMAEKWGVTRRRVQDLDTNGLFRRILRDRRMDVLSLENTEIGEKRKIIHRSDILRPCADCLIYHIS